MPFCLNFSRVSGNVFVLCLLSVLTGCSPGESSLARSDKAIHAQAWDIDAASAGFLYTNETNITEFGVRSVGRIEFVSGYATSRTETSGLSQDSQSSIVVFDLKNMSWHDLSNDWLVSKDQWTQWIQRRKRSTLDAVNSLSEGVDKRNALSRLKPHFESENKDGILAFGNDYTSYRVLDSTKLSPSRTQAFFAYQPLNAYHKAMGATKELPNTELAAIHEFEKHGLVPLEMNLQVSSGILKMSIRLNARVRDLSSEEEHEALKFVETLAHSVAAHTTTPRPMDEIVTE